MTGVDEFNGFDGLSPPLLPFVDPLVRRLVVMVDLSTLVFASLCESRRAMLLFSSMGHSSFGSHAGCFSFCASYIVCFLHLIDVDGDGFWEVLNY